MIWTRKTSNRRGLSKKKIQNIKVYRRGFRNIRFVVTVFYLFRITLCLPYALLSQSVMLFETITIVCRKTH